MRDALADAGVESSALQGRRRGVAGARWTRPPARSGARCTSWDWGTGFRLTDALAEALGAPAFVGNDVQVATDAEFALGAGRSTGSLLGVFWGTGRGRRHRAGRQAVDGARLRRRDRPHGRARGREALPLRAPRVHGGLRRARCDGGPRAARGASAASTRAVRHHGAAGARPAHERRLGTGAAQGRPARDPSARSRRAGARHGRRLRAQRARRRGGRDRRRAGGAARPDVPRAPQRGDHDPPVLALAAGGADRPRWAIWAVRSGPRCSRNRLREAEKRLPRNNFARSFVHMLFCRRKPMETALGKGRGES